MKKVNLTLRIFFVSILVIACGKSEEPEPSIKVETGIKLVPVRISNSVANPWGMTFLNEDEFLVTEKGGAIYHFKNDKLENSNVQGVPKVTSVGQGGLLDIAKHPNFEFNQWIYMTYVIETTPGYALRLARYQWNGEGFENEEILYTDESSSNETHHFGSRIAFDGAGFVYFSIGDRGRREVFPQSLEVGAGKIHRLHDDGRIPADNPYVNTSKLATIYSSGHRNPQGLIFHPQLNQIWSHEHGPLGGDELNIIKKGSNYGWPEITYGLNYDGTLITDEKEREGMEQPEAYWVPSIAPCGMAVIQNSIYTDWEGDILMGSLKFDYVVKIEVDENGYQRQENILTQIGRVRNVQMGLNGHFYVATQGNGIFRIDIAE